MSSPKTIALAPASYHRESQTRKARNYTVDTFRLLGAFSVIFLHSIETEDMPSTAHILLKGLTRWAVPFFFIVSGYYFEAAYTSDPQGSILNRLKNLIGIFISANLIFFAFFVFRYKGSGMYSFLNVSSLMMGDYYHLWFIGSMMLGYIIMWFVLEQRPHRNVLVLIIGGSLLLVLGTGSYATLLGLKVQDQSIWFARHLTSVPCLLVGYFCAKYRVLDYVNLRTAVLLAVFGFTMQLLESYMIYRLTGFEAHAHDFLIGIFVFALGVFLYCMKALTPRDTLITKTGRDYSLLLYLYHPVILGLGLENLFDGIYTLSWIKPVMVFGVCLSLILILDRKSPTIYSFVSGKIWN